MHMTNFVSKIDKKYTQNDQFHQFKNPGGYIAKSKAQGICLQLSQTPGGDYAIWPLFIRAWAR